VHTRANSLQRTTSTRSFSLSTESRVRFLLPVNKRGIVNFNTADITAMQQLLSSTRCHSRISPPINFGKDQSPEDEIRHQMTSSIDSLQRVSQYASVFVKYQPVFSWFSLLSDRIETTAVKPVLRIHKLYLLTPLNRVLREKLIVFQLVKKCPAFYGTRRFITAFTSAHRLFLFINHSGHYVVLDPGGKLLLRRQVPTLRNYLLPPTASYNIRT